MEYFDWTIVKQLQPDNIDISIEAEDKWDEKLKIYLLRLRNDKVERYTIFAGEEHIKLGFPPYLIAELPIQKINDDFIEKILLKFGGLK